MLEDLLERQDIVSAALQFRVPLFPWWLLFVALLVFAGIGAYVIATQGPTVVLLVWEAFILYALYQQVRRYPKGARCFVLTQEAIERRGHRRQIRIQWAEITEVVVRDNSLIVISQGNKILIPRNLPRHSELYTAIKARVPPAAVQTTSGLPVRFRHGSSIWIWIWHVWIVALMGCAVVFITWYWAQGVLSNVVFGGFMMGFFIWLAAKVFYSQSFRYEFHNDRILVQAWLRRKEYSKSQLRDTYLESVKQQDGDSSTHLNLVFADGDSYALGDGNMKVEKLFRILKAHYLPEPTSSPIRNRSSILGL